MAEVWNYFANEDAYPDLDQAAAVEHLSQVLQCKTVSNADRTKVDWSEFDKLKAYIKKSYPHIFNSAAAEEIDQSLLIRIPGTQKELKPLLLMSHMDVVPVIEGTEDDWTYPAFSGHVDDTYIWGRGTADIKGMLTGILEAAEYALAHNFKLKRGLILAFGQDEECLQSGAAKIAKHLQDQGVELEFLIDEGDYRIINLAHLGAPEKRVMRVCLAEKGYADLRLRVKSIGGHSSNPYGGTSLGIISEAISRIAKADWGTRLTELQRAELAAVAPYVKNGGLAELISGGKEAIEAHEQEITQYFCTHKDLYPLITTTAAPTIIRGSSQAPNVLPQNMEAIINFRLLQGTTHKDLLDQASELLSDLDVEIDILNNGGNDPSQVSRFDTEALAPLKKVAARFFCQGGEPLPVVPALIGAATDAHKYQDICDRCFRFSAFVVDDDEFLRGVHGTDERITRRAYLQGIRFMIGLIEEVCTKV